ncbi:MAG: NlpC/P60 family protein [Oscillospiraceae bacterium]|nr:NlpC/P60 family protein [Oscillospiraceae bacterium]
MRSALKEALRGSAYRYAVSESDPLRTAVVESACSLVGRVPYYWGGKSEIVGWDARWGSPARFGDGSVAPFGLDCSGFITWCFVNASDASTALAAIGHGTRQQFLNCIPLNEDSAQPGDLAFTLADGIAIHGGIIVGHNENGEFLLCHAAGREEENIVIEPISRTGCNVLCAPEAFYAAGSD